MATQRRHPRSAPSIKASQRVSMWEAFLPRSLVKRSQRHGSGPANSRSIAVSTADIAIWLMVLAVLVWVPGGYSRFVVAKLLVSSAACLAAGLAQVDRALPRRLVVALGCGATFFVVAALLGETPVASLIGRWPRYEGLPVLAIYAACAWAGARVLDPTRQRTLIAAVETMTWILTAATLLDLAGVSPLGHSSASRSGSLLGNATDQGLIAMMAMFVLLPRAISERRIQTWAPVVAALVTIGASGSRTSLLLAVAGGALIAWRTWGSGRITRQQVVTAGAALGVLVITVLAVPTTRERLFAATTVTGRGLQWRLTGNLIADHPWLGIGPSRYVDAFGAYETREWVRFTGIRTVPDSPHNLVLQVLVAGGIPLFLCALALTVIGLRAAWNTVKEAPVMLGLFVAVSAYGIGMLANFTIASTTCLAAFLAGGLVGVRRAGTANHAPQDPWRWALVAGSGVAVVAFATAAISEIVLEHGIKQAAAGHPGAAASRFDTAASLRPFDADVPMLAAQSLAELADANVPGATAPTLRFARASLQRTPETFASRTALAAGLISEGKLDEAVRFLDESIKLYPERPTAWIQRGIARFGLQDADGALDDLKVAIAIDPKAEGAHKVRQAMLEQIRQRR